MSLTHTKAFETYLVEQINSFCKKKIEYSNFEPFSDSTTNKFEQYFGLLKFSNLFEYIESNSKVEGNKIVNLFIGYLKSNDEKLRLKLKLLKVKYPTAFELLKSLKKINLNKTTNANEWIKLPTQFRHEDIILLEKLQIIFTREYSEFIFQNKRIIELDI